MSISSTKPVVNKPTEEQVKAVQEAVAELAKNPNALFLARLQYLMKLAEQDERVKLLLHTSMESVSNQVRELGLEAF